MTFFWVCGLATLCAWLYVRTVQLARQARESNKRRLMSRWKNERAIEETVRSGPELNLLLMEESAGRSWHGMGRSSTYTTACNSAIPIQATYALHSSRSRQNSSNSTLHMHACSCTGSCLCVPNLPRIFCWAKEDRSESQKKNS